jgi:hypothetical protein
MKSITKKLLVSFLIATAGVSVSAENLFKGTNFSADSGWCFWIDNSVKDAGGSITFQDGKVTLKSPASATQASWQIQLFKHIEIDVDKSYKLKFKANAGKPGKISVSYQGKNNAFYAKVTIDVEQGDKDYECTFMVKNDKDGKYESPRSLHLYLGGIKDATVTLSDVSIEESK